MRWPWRRRTPAGRHALGAAVTAVPSGPPLLPADLQTVTSAVPGARPAVPCVPEPRTAVAEVPDRPVPTAEVQPVLPVAAGSGVPRQSAPTETLSMDAFLVLAPLVGSAVPGAPPVQPPLADAPSAWATPSPPSEPVVPAVASFPWVVPAAARPVPPPPSRGGPRVELGFADGTFRMLDPASDTARVLSELVGELTATAERGSEGDDLGPNGSERA